MRKLRSGCGLQPKLTMPGLSGIPDQLLDFAMQIVEAAAPAGARPITIMPRKADTMTRDLSEGSFFIDGVDILRSSRTLEAGNGFAAHDVLAFRRDKNSAPPEMDFVLSGRVSPDIFRGEGLLWSDQQ